MNGIFLTLKKVWLYKEPLVRGDYPIRPLANNKSPAQDFGLNFGDYRENGVVIFSGEPAPPKGHWWKVIGGGEK